MAVLGNKWISDQRPIADAIDVLAKRLHASRDQAWKEIKSKVRRGSLSLDGIDETGRTVGIEAHWIDYIEPWETGDIPDRESGSMIAFDLARAIRDRRADQREGRQCRSVPPLRIRDLEVDCAQLASLWAEGTSRPEPPRKSSVPAALRAAIKKVRTELGEPGKSPKAPWKRFCDQVRTERGISESPPPRGFGDKSIQRTVKAVRGEQDKPDI
jgi:hypothetical protein